MDEINHLNEEALAQAADAVASNNYDHLPNEIKTHLAECDQCAAEVVAISQILDETHSETISIPFYKTSLFRATIGVAALLAIVFGFYFIFNSSPDNSTRFADQTDTNQVIAPNEKENQTSPNFDTIQNNEPAPKANQRTNPANDNLLAFNTNEDLEKVYLRHQDGVMRSNDVKISADSVISISKGKRLSIAWEADGSELIFEIWNNRNQKVVEKSTNATTGLNLPAPESAGLYYWKLLNADFELVYCGKIRVEE